MKIMFASLILTLAAYAQACCADDLQFNVFSQKQHLIDSTEQSIQPTWLFTGQSGSPQLMGFTQVTRIQQHLESKQSVEHIMGFGVHQQITPFLYTQVVVTEQDGGQSAVKVGVEF